MATNDNPTPAPLTRDERLRRALLVCCHFARNVAYYRSRRAGIETAHKGEEFWITVDSNFIDVAVLEWCKLFADDSAKHHWSRMVTNSSEFYPDLVAEIGLSEEGFLKVIGAFKFYRDKFIAHLDSERTMTPPFLDPALKAAFFLHRHIWEREIDPIHRGALPADIEGYYAWCLAEAEDVYRPGRNT